MKENERIKSSSNSSIDATEIRPPFPERLRKVDKRVELDKELLNIFKKVEINLPLLDAIKQVPRYAKFLKDLCTNKRKLKGNERIICSENVSAVIQRKLPQKQKDPGIFAIPCTIGNSMIDKCMLDLGSSINVMPKSIYTSLDLGPLQPTGITVQLADRSVVYPEGVIEDVLVKVKGLVFPVDFYVLKMEDDYSQLSNLSPILLGRPFMRTAKTIIDVHNGILSMEFDGDKIFFNIYEAMKHPYNEITSVCAIDVIDSYIEDISEYDSDEGLYASLCYGLKETATDLNSLAYDEDYHENLSWLETSTSSTHPLLDQTIY